jgi:hypothetical protein
VPPGCPRVSPQRPAIPVRALTRIIQAKRWRSAVGVEAVRALAPIESKRASTTGACFTRPFAAITDDEYTERRRQIISEI